MGRKYVPSTKDCLVCVRWTCTRCGWSKGNMNPYPAYGHRCPRCGCMDGSMRPTRHSRKTWLGHNEGQPDPWRVPEAAQP